MFLSSVKFVKYNRLKVHFGLLNVGEDGAIYASFCTLLSHYLTQNSVDSPIPVCLVLY